MEILLIDDHALFREGLVHVLNRLGGPVTILEAQDAVSASRILEQNAALDLVLLDLNLPGENGFSLLEKIIAQFPTIPVVIVSASTRHSDIRWALDAGAMGFIPKSSASDAMLRALTLVLDGGVFVPIEALNSKQEDGLTQRQQEVLDLIIQGHSNQAIADQLCLAEATVKMHVSAIFRALGVTNRTQAAMVAKERLF